jgi:hypothetical protein
MDAEKTDCREADEATAPRRPPEALRALAEAEERRRARTEAARAPEIGGRGGLDPARYGDWEVGGLASDF